jgi:8-oxo-dGTP pyrophosphatase MutT (NUDIX family)
MHLAQQLADWADQLRHLSAMGLYYATNPYDRERYQTLQTLMLEMQALAGGELPTQLEPLRAQIFARPCPFSCADAAIIDDSGRMLLIQRADNQCWAMPGGSLDVGETPAEGAVREAREETGIACEPVQLVGVFDSRFAGGEHRHHLYQFVFLCRPLDDHHVTPSHANEILAMEWFAEAALPHPLDANHVRRIPYAFAAWRGEQRAFFDS